MKKIFTKFNILIFALAPVLLVLDLVSKVLTDGKNFTLIKNLLSFQSEHNTGAAFSLLEGARWLFILLTCLVVALFIVFHIKNKYQNFLYATSFAFIMAGTLGNLIDRIVFGYVRDFIHINFFPAIFNVADICLTIGVILFMIYILFFYKPVPKKVSETETTKTVNFDDFKADFKSVLNENLETIENKSTKEKNVLNDNLGAINKTDNKNTKEKNEKNINLENIYNKTQSKSTKEKSGGESASKNK